MAIHKLTESRMVYSKIVNHLSPEKQEIGRTLIRYKVMPFFGRTLFRILFKTKDKALRKQYLVEMNKWEKLVIFIYYTVWVAFLKKVGLYSKVMNRYTKVLLADDTR
jgi:hypothetical protein